MNQFRPISPPEDAQTPRVAPVLAALALGGFAIGTTEFATMSLLPFFAPDLGVTEARASHAISAYALGVVVGAPLLAVLGARMDRRRLLVGLMLLFAGGNLLSAMASDFGQMLAFRFLAGVPHGAYFGVAALMAASMVPLAKRAQAMARVMLGLTVATIIGVPLANIIGQQFGWRWGFGLVTACALATAALIAWLAPSQPAKAGQSPLTELGALANGQVWLTLSIGAIGFGGLFAVYTYLASTLLDVTMAPAAAIPAVLALFGLGMTLGTLVAGWGADRALMPTVGIMLALAAVVLALFPFAAHSLWTLCPLVFLLGITGSFGVPLQARLMDVAGKAQTLAASLHHSAFNFANALGPWLAGMAVAAGYGFESSGFVGAGLALGGLLMWGIAMLSDRRRG
ncbi:MFS transporter [Sandaracinobacter neustonicus]|uniref:MFS transporter n=1 Tax=Sandaracinobacter neustonicus TaxID=1715348 RepID=A0A501XHQ4_9SPHN|nr:MFS transporter [Sandaracinobacter neustonicus]TPE60070.1 MFS transporter [Sandaracinobacter neustonicus]